MTRPHRAIEPRSWSEGAESHEQIAKAHAYLEELFQRPISSQSTLRRATTIIVKSSPVLVGSAAM